MSENGPINYHALPLGTFLTFRTTQGDRIVVEIFGGFMNRSYGSARQVKVLEAPHRSADSMQPTHLLCVPTGTYVPTMAYAYCAAMPTISVGDTIFLLTDVYDGAQLPPYFEIEEMQVELPG